MKKGTIFVSVASYRDSMCNDTIKSLYSNAKYPENIFVGICQQNIPGNDVEKCNLDTTGIPAGNIRVITINYSETKGPTYARHLCSTLYDDEEFFFQSDSHMLFVKDWDIKCINMLHQIEDLGLSQSPYTVLSTYPPDIAEYSNYNPETKNNVTRICKFFFNSRGMISQMGAETMDSGGMPYKTPFIAGGFLFGYANILKDVPFDPNLDFLFVGEEILLSARLYTHGYEVFTPPEVICFHYYTRPESPKIWTDRTYSDIPAFKKAMKLLNLDTSVDEALLPENITMNISRYGMGTKRTLDDFYDFVGVDLENKRVTKNFCKQDNLASQEDIDQSNESNTLIPTLKTIKSVINYNTYGLSHSRKLFCLLFILSVIIASLIVVIVYNYDTVETFFMKNVKISEIYNWISKYISNLFPHRNRK